MRASLLLSRCLVVTHRIRLLSTCPRFHTKDDAKLKAIRRNPYFEKYQDRILEFQKLSPETFNEKIKQAKSVMSDQEMKQPPAPKGLDDILKMETVEDKSADELTKTRQRRSKLFSAEIERQRNLVNRIEKITVNYNGVPEACTMLMNKGLSTPYSCALHINEWTAKRSLVALVDGEPWDMHRPLVKDCGNLEFIHAKSEIPHIANLAFWRTGSFILGYVIETAFKEEFSNVELCYFPRPNIESGSFVYDADLKMGDSILSQTELNCLTRIAGRLRYRDLMFERLDIPLNIALDMFEDNRFKREQLPSIAEQSVLPETVTVYRMGDHVDVTRGPLISNTNQIGRFDVTAVHHFDSGKLGLLSRMQGLGLPVDFFIHDVSYNILKKRATHFNSESDFLHGKQN